MLFKDQTILITGGTGSFGQKCVETLLKNHQPRKLIIYSRDELKQSLMQERFNQYPSLRFFIGDIRDKERLNWAMSGVDYVIHAAALKQVPAIEYNPFEAVRTNIIGAYNVISCAIDHNVKKVIALSTDKAANPINLYGATKLCSDKIFISANHLASNHPTQLSVVRYGNVLGSRGSVVPLFMRKKTSGTIPITDTRMTRFIITLEQGVDFVLKSFERMVGGEVFVPKIPSVKIIDMAKAIAPNCQMVVTGIRPGEKLHEVMVPEEEARNTLEFEDYYIIQPQFHWWNSSQLKTLQGKLCEDGFVYASHTNPVFLNPEEIRSLIEKHVSPLEQITPFEDHSKIENSLEEKNENDDSLQSTTH